MKKNSLYFLSGILFLVAVWVVVYLAVANEIIIPSPINAIKKTFILFGEGYFYSALFSTLLRVLLAFFISLILAVITAILSYKFSGVASIFSVVTGALRALPTLAVLLIILVAVSRNFAPVIVCVLTLYPILHTAIFNELCGVDKGVIQMVNAYRLPLTKRVFNVFIPTILPGLILNFTAGISFAIKLIVSAEILANVYGSIGGLLDQASLLSDIELLFAFTIAVCVIGIIVDFIGKIAYEMLKRGRI